MASEQLAILFADICDSTTIYESIGDARALAAINRVFTLLREKVEANGGKVIKTLGDGMVCQFLSADALSAPPARCRRVTAAHADAGPR